VEPILAGHVTRERTFEGIEGLAPGEERIDVVEPVRGSRTVDTGPLVPQRTIQRKAVFAVRRG